MNFSKNNKWLSKQAGYTLLELLVSMAIAGGLLLSVMRQYVLTVQESRDNQIRVATFLEAQAVVQNIAFELRVLGNGVPFDQANFQIGELNLSDPTVTEPIEVATATSSNIAFRSNETGDVFLLAEDFDPASSLTVKLTDVSSLSANDPVFLNNSVVSGNDGLFGVITNVNTGSKEITIDNNYVTTPTGATFDKGTLLEEVPMVTYNYDSTLDEITRNSGFGPVVVAENSSLQIEYLDFNGTPLPLPLSSNDIVDNLRSMRLTVSVISGSLMSDGNKHTSTVSQVVGLRNLNYLF